MTTAPMSFRGRCLSLGGFRARLTVLRRGARRSDAGVTLMELVVGMTIMTIFMAIFTGSVVMMYNSTSKSEAIADTSSQLSIAFNRLDKSIRYASAISPPGKSSGAWYVEWETTYTGTPQCTQLRLNPAAQQLQQRTWTVSGGSATNVTAWLPLASGVTDTDPTTGAAVTPFTFTMSDAAVPYEQLGIRLVALSVGRTGTTTSISDVTFTAFNSRLTTATTGICAEKGRS